MDTAGTPGGFFITFEGPEGAGKSTQVHHLAAVLADQGFSVWTSREPGGTRAGEMIRPILLGGNVARLSPWTEALLFSAARAQHVAEVIRPRLDRGEVIICDRFSDSTIAYQGYGRGLDLETLRRLQVEATGGLRPDLTLLLNLPVQTGLARIPGDAKDRLDREAIVFHERVRAGYREMALQDPQRWQEVDASAPAEQVGRLILDIATRAMARAGVRPVDRRTA